MLMKLYEAIWRLLPDKCEVPHCRRKGVRGNENRVEGMIACDDCSVELMEMRKHYEEN